MAATFIDCYLEGLLVDSLGTLALFVLFLFIYRAEVRKKRREPKRSVARETGIRPAPGKAAVESARYFFLAGILFLLLYVWITPIMPYAGTVEKKDYRVRGRPDRSQFPL